MLYKVEMLCQLITGEICAQYLMLLDFNVAFLLELPEQPIINDMHETVSKCRTALTSAVHNVYQSKQNSAPVYWWNYYSQSLFDTAL